MKLTRRQFLRTGAVAGGGLALTGIVIGKGARTVYAAKLNPNSIPKYVTQLVKPSYMPIISTAGGIDSYEVAARQFKQQILPPGRPSTKVWSFVSPQHPATFRTPPATIEAQFNRTARVKWINGLVDSSGGYLRHPLNVDQTLHWANPPGGIGGRDSHGTSTRSYTGPVPIVVHLHGALSNEESDGYPEGWYLPAANNIPAGYATVGSYYDQFNAKAAAYLGQSWAPGTATFTYPNDQRATTLWYHDHTLGMTRLNNNAGLGGGFYLLRGGPDDLPAGVLPGGTYEIPIVIQDRTFNTNGSLNHSDEFETGFLGDTMVTNGNTWPNLNVERRRYRLRFLNACNARTLILKVASDPTAVRPAPAALPFWQIGADGGFLAAPAMLQQLVLMVAERADVIVDFTDLPEGTVLYLINEGPDDSFQAGAGFANPATTGQVMRFVVGPLTSADNSTPPQFLTLPAITPLGPHVKRRRLLLQHVESGDDEIMLLGGLDPGSAGTKMWSDPITENPGLGDVERWEITNSTEHAHPIHLHLVQFEVVGRLLRNGVTRPPEAGETGTKDTVRAQRDEVTILKAKFDIPGLSVWHCHILEHEDKEMMRPFFTGSLP